MSRDTSIFSSSRVTERSRIWFMLRRRRFTVCAPKRLFGWPTVPIRQSRSMQRRNGRSEEHTSELQSLMRISYAVFCLKKHKKKKVKKGFYSLVKKTKRTRGRNQDGDSN